MDKPSKPSGVRDDRRPPSRGDTWSRITIEEILVLMKRPDTPVEEKQKLSARLREIADTTESYALKTYLRSVANCLVSPYS